LIQCEPTKANTIQRVSKTTSCFLLQDSGSLDSSGPEEGAGRITARKRDR